MLLFSTHRPQLLTAGRLSVGAGYGTIIVSIPWIEVRNIKIVIITGSAHRHGTTATLTDHFQRGVESAGHEVFRFDAAFKNVPPCIGCDKCNRTGECAFVADDMKELTPHLLEADAVVFVSPIYYFDINAQLKSVIDRFYANNPALMGKKKTVLITAMADPDKKTASAANTMYDLMTSYLDWEVAGRLNFGGCYTADDLREEDLTAACELGKNL